MHNRSFFVTLYSVTEEVPQPPHLSLFQDSPVTLPQAWMYDRSGIIIMRSNRCATQDSEGIYIQGQSSEKIDTECFLTVCLSH